MEDFPRAVGLSVENFNANRPDEAITFDSSCPGGCTGGDDDLQTPGAGPGNSVGLGNVLIIAEDVNDNDDDGLVDDPDDENDGGTIEIQFSVPQKLRGLRAVDFEASEIPSQVELDLVAGGTQVVPFARLGDNSQEMIIVPDAGAATAIRIIYGSTGAVDELEYEDACGDSIIDPGEDCDPPFSLGGASTCSDACTTQDPVCGDGNLDPGEECDPPASEGGAPDCREDCLLTECGDGMTEGTEECDPPASSGGAADCRDDCTIAICGDSILDPGEDCDPPASQGGDPLCDDSCQLAPPSSCGDSVVDPGEECDPPASQGGDPLCNDNCLLSICGDGMVEAGEVCDPPASQGGDADCKDDCTRSICGDSVVETGEACDPPASQGGAPDCNDDCSLTQCGDDEVEAGEECDPPASQGGDPLCQDDCTLAPMPECGDMVLDPGEECDPPASLGGSPMCNSDCTLSVCGDGTVGAGEECDPPASQGGSPFCADDCTLGVCGDGNVDPGEECDPEGMEICDNLLDDDGDGFVDCADPDCAPGLDFCTRDCTLTPNNCQPILDDPAVIKFKDGPHDYFNIHGRVPLTPPAMGGTLDPVNVAFTLELRNSNGLIYRGQIGAGSLRASGKRYRFKDQAAKFGTGNDDGVFRVMNRFRKIKGVWYYTFRFSAYADFENGQQREDGIPTVGATESYMWTQVYGVEGPAILGADWNKKRNGWTLRRSQFGALPLP